MRSINRDRRQFLCNSLTFSGLPLLGMSPFSSAIGDERFLLESVHIEAAKKAASLVSEPITLVALLPEGSLANVKPVATEFSQLSGIKFEFIETPVDDINTRMFLDSRKSESSYDIALPATFGISDLVEAGAITSLSAFASRYEPVGFQNNSLYTIGDYYRDEFYGYQSDGDTYLMFYNNRLMENEALTKSFSDKHGYAIKIPQTWEELDAMMAHFHDPKKGIYGGALFRVPTYMLWEWWIRFHAKGFFPFDENLMPQINNEAGVQALEELIQATSFLTPNAASNGLFDNWREFSNGNIFCNIGWGGTQKYLNSSKSAIRGHLKYGPTPGGIVNSKLLKTSYFNWGWNYTVSKNSPNKEIAYLFTLFACSPVMSTLSVRQKDGYFDPFRVEHYQDKIISDTYSAEFLVEHRESMLNSIPDLYLKGQTQYYDALRHNINEAHDRKISARKALDNTAKIWKRLNLKLDRSIQTEQWLSISRRYPDSLREMLQ